MADLPMAQIPSFQAPSVPYMGNALTGAAQGFQQGIQNYQQFAQLAQKAKQMQMERGQYIVKNAIDAYNAYGDDIGPESFQAFKQGMNMIAPGTVDPSLNWTPEVSQKMKTVGNAFDAAVNGDRPWPEAIGVISKVMATAGIQQRARMEPILNSAKDIYGQQQTNNRNIYDQGQNTQRNYADHANPMIQAGAALNTVNDLLSKKDAVSDATAKSMLSTLIANGHISQDEINQLTTAGGPLEKLGSWWNSKTAGKIDDYHRAEIQKYIPTKIDQLNNTLQSLATAFPGASPAKISFRMTKQSKSGKPIVSLDGGKTWQYQEQSQ